MVFWTVLLIVGILAGVAGHLAQNQNLRERQANYQRQKSDRHYYHSDPPNRKFDSLVIAAIVLAIFWVVPTVIGTAIVWGASLNAKNSTEVLAMKEEQRDELIDTVRDELSNEQYKDLLSATTEDAIVVIFGTQGVSDFLVQRAQTIVTLNKELFDMRLDIARDRKDVCNAVQNPFYPLLPFGAPDCDLRGAAEAEQD